METPQTETQEKPLEFWVEEDQFPESVVLILAREVGDGAFKGKSRLLLKADLTPELFARTYEQMLYDYQADHNEQL